MLGQMRKTWVILLPVLGLCGCSSSEDFTANVAGSYSVAITNGASSCNFDNWVEGNQTSNIGLVITQEGKTLHGTIDGAAGLLFTLFLGSAEFDGSVKGNSLTLTNFGKNPAQQGNCSYTYNATVDASQTGDNISGEITYATKTNGNPDCDAVECSATQRFNGTRPPE